MAGLADMWAEWSARRFLSRLADQVGVSGLAAAATAPALLAAVDQHSAAVRDIVTYGVEGSAAVASVVLLAGYAKGVLDQAQKQGWRFRGPITAAADWTTVRLIGVCALAGGLDQRVNGADGRGAHV
jgi:Family of unknown function (DUF6401)